MKVVRGDRVVDLGPYEDTPELFHMAECAREAWARAGVHEGHPATPEDIDKPRVFPIWRAS